MLSNNIYDQTELKKINKADNSLIASFGTCT